MSNAGLFSAWPHFVWIDALERFHVGAGAEARPAPVSTMTRTLSSALAPHASRTSRSMIAVHAFIRSGRLSVMVAMLSLTS